MRSASTSRLLERASRSQLAAEPVRGEQLRERAPLRVPGAGRALVLLRPSPASSVATRPGACVAQPSAETAATGLCLCGIDEEPPPAPLRAPRRPRSGRAGRCRARPCRPRPRRRRARPPARRSGRAACARRQRRPSRRAAQRRRRLVGPRPRGAACPPGRRAATARRSLAHASSAVAASSSATSQPAALRPNVVGSACWSSVRPIIGVSRCAAGERAPRRRRRRAGRRSSGTSARLATSIAAVSRMSWLVAPRCTGASGRAVERLQPRAPAPGLPIPAAPAPIAATS